MKIVKENKKLLVLIILFSGLLIMQFNFFWNEYVNNNISNMYSYISLSLRPGATTIYNIFYNFEILNSPVMIWLFQFALLLICLVLYYKSISYLINESIAFLSSIFFILSPYTINLMKVIDFYPLILIWYTLSNLVFILYLKKKKPGYVYYLMIINLTGIILDFYFLTFILIQALYLLFQEKLGIKKKICGLFSSF